MKKLSLKLIIALLVCAQSLADNEPASNISVEEIEKEISRVSREHKQIPSKRCKKQCNLSHTITLGLTDSSFTPLNIPTFDVKLDIIVNGPLVTITIPSINFILPVDGFVYTAGNNLPKLLWPVSTVPPASFLAVDGTAINLQAYIYSDGTLRIKSLGGTAIAAGTYSTNTLTFSYRIPCPRVCAPHNFKISKRSSNIIGTYSDQVVGIDYGDAFRNDIRGDRVAFCWNQTVEGVPLDETTTQLVVCTGKLNSENKLKLNKPVVAFTPPNKGGTFDSQVLIDPKNPDHLVAAASQYAFNNLAAPFPFLPIQITILHSFDFGKTWESQPGPLYGITIKPNLAIEEQMMLFDDFGNLYLAFFIFSVGTNDSIFPIREWQLFNSIDGGLTWKNIFVIQSSNPKAFPDFPQLAFGPDGKGGHALWYAWTNLQGFLVPPVFCDIYAGYLPVLGRGDFGTHVEHKLSNIPTNTAANVQLAVGNNGQVFLAAQQYNPVDFLSPAFDSRMFLYLNPTGTVDFTPTSFQRQQDIFVTNIGQDQYTDPTPVSWQPARGFFPDAVNFFAYDKKKSRLYAVIIDRKPNFDIADYVAISYIYTDNNGASWSKMFPVNDVHFASRGLASVAFEQDKGLMSIGFYDTRLHGPTNTTVDYFGTIFDPEEFIK